MGGYVFGTLKRKAAAVAVAIGMLGAPLAVVATDVAPAGAIQLSCNTLWTSAQSIYGWAWTDYSWQSCYRMRVRTLYLSGGTRLGAAWTNEATDTGISWHPAPPGTGSYYSTPAGFGSWYGVQVEAYDLTHGYWQCYTYYVYPYTEWVQNTGCNYV